MVETYFDHWRPDHIPADAIVNRLSTATHSVLRFKTDHKIFQHARFRVSDHIQDIGPDQVGRQRLDVMLQCRLQAGVTQRG